MRKNSHSPSLEVSVLKKSAQKNLFSMYLEQAYREKSYTRP